MNTDYAANLDQPTQTSLQQSQDAQPGQAQAPVARAEPGNRARLRIVATSVAATLLVLAAVAWLWGLYDDWRAGRIVLTARGEPLVVQVLAESSDTTVGVPIEVVSSATLALPAGDYRLRVNGKGRLGRTYRVAVNRGETQAHAISLDEGRLLGEEPRPPGLREKEARVPPIPLATVTAALELESGRADFIEWSEGSLICRDGATGKIRWDGYHPATPFSRKRDPAQWFPTLSGDRRVELVEPACDLDGDGTRDLLWCFRGLSTFLAVSGKDGAVLWNHVVVLNSPGDGSSKPTPSDGRQRALAGVPAMMYVNHDGRPDLVITMLFSETPEENTKRLAESAGAAPRNQEMLFQRVAMAISGKTGTWLWSHALDPKCDGTRENLERSAGMLVEAAKSRFLAFLFDSHWSGLDPATGNVLAGPLDLGFIPAYPVVHTDLDGDGQIDVLALGPATSGTEKVLYAYSVKPFRQRWAVGVGEAFDPNASRAQPWEILLRNRPRFPASALFADLDGDGKTDIIVPDSGSMPPIAGQRGLRRIDGETGATRWQRPLRPETRSDDGVAHIVAAPDLDGDGTRDVVAISHYRGRDPWFARTAPPDEPDRVYVDALSGKDGRVRWIAYEDLPNARLTQIPTPLWWGRGPDGWPLLALQLGGEDPDPSPYGFRDESTAAPIVHIFEASTGRKRHEIRGLDRISAADLNGDGLVDLWGEVDGELRAFRGEAPEAWRALGQFEPATATDLNSDFTKSRSVDLDRDGVADALIAGLEAPGTRSFDLTGSQVAVARSGRDGRVIWKAAIDPRESWHSPNSGNEYALVAFPLPGGDIDGDGTPDVIAKEKPGIAGMSSRREFKPSIKLLSGRTGARLWSVGRLPESVGIPGLSEQDWMAPQVIEPGTKPDLIARFSAPESSCIVRISGRDGRVLWDFPTSGDDPFHASGGALPAQFADLDGDGVLDVLFVVPHTTDAQSVEHTLVALSLGQGKKLWSEPVRFTSGIHTVGAMGIGDLDGDKRPEAIVLEAFDETNKSELIVRVFDGAKGNVRWSWKSGFAPSQIVDWQSLVLADFEGKGITSICVRHEARRFLRSWDRVVVLDEAGKERVRRDLPETLNIRVTPADLNSDGRQKLLIVAPDQDMPEGRLFAWDRELKDLWVWPAPAPRLTPPNSDAAMAAVMQRRDRSRSVDRILPASGGRSGAILLTTGVAHDAATGRPVWKDQPALERRPSADRSSEFMAPPPQFVPKLLDAGAGSRPVLTLATGLGATVCREAMPTTAEGAIAPPRGRLAVPGRSIDDPRWTRPLPWRIWLKGGFFGPNEYLVAAGLALLNVILPLFILWLIAGRRRVFRMWALMVLPVAAAVPLVAYPRIVPWLPVGDFPIFASEGTVFCAATIAGLPIVLCTLLACADLVRLRFRGIAVLALLALIASLCIAAGWLWHDRKSLAALEHYGPDGWELVLLPGAYIAAVVWFSGWALLEGYRDLRKRAR